jgi:hypothetical protein
MKRSSRKASTLYREPGWLETGRGGIPKALWSCRRNAIRVSKT